MSFATKKKKIVPEGNNASHMAEVNANLKKALSQAKEQIEELKKIIVATLGRDDPRGPNPDGGGEKVGVGERVEQPSALISTAVTSLPLSNDVDVILLLFKQLMK